MELYNYMEDIVSDALEALLADKDKENESICKCQKCKLDMVAWALNRLSPKYVVSSKGRVYTKLQQVEIQSKADVTRELTKARQHISKNPQH